MKFVPKKKKDRACLLGELVTGTVFQRDDTPENVVYLKMSGTLNAVVLSSPDGAVALRPGDSMHIPSQTPARILNVSLVEEG